MSLLFGCAVLMASCSDGDDPKPNAGTGGSSENELIKFIFKVTDNSSLASDVTGTVDQDNKTVFVIVPNGVNLNVLTPAIQVSDHATVTPTGSQNFTNPVMYTVTAEDGTQKKYEVTVMDVSTSQRAALVAIYNANPGNTINWDFSEADINNWDGVTANNAEGYVTFLRIAKKGISEIPVEIKYLTKLNYIDFGYNELTTIPKELCTLRELTSLNLNDNELSSIPDKVGQLTNLTTLVLYKNQLSSIPAEIGQLTQLTSLSLSNNKLTGVPPEIGQLAKLHTLALDNNQLTSIPKEVGQLHKALYLVLSTNKLTSIPAEVGQMESLIELYMDDNQLSSIPVEIGQLTKLTNLYLPNNQLTSIPQAVCDLTPNQKTNITVDAGVTCQ